MILGTANQKIGCSARAINFGSNARVAGLQSIFIQSRIVSAYGVDKVRPLAVVKGVVQRINPAYVRAELYLPTQIEGYMNP